MSFQFYIRVVTLNINIASISQYLMSSILLTINIASISQYLMSSILLHCISFMLQCNF